MKVLDRLHIILHYIAHGLQKIEKKILLQLFEVQIVVFYSVVYYRLLVESSIDDLYDTNIQYLTNN